ncbi:ATP-binding cassette domain-containing protein [Collinsella sp. zg1085]|uniref:ATP-binding cassette domain-containing protein n=1 Tax=Collinsella sp. zg1085 TaxID=2844380 RepID=UPI001C0DE49E|nr:ATP-binding cassette domain-containing protein [Collinsella sp. zg1085]QWT17311.1 ATP-binding cassette domain-containing protein [Collinsella sp. zg1085]
MLELKHLSYETALNRVLDDISLKLSPGELMVIAGANGSGKSTLARIMTGALLVKPGMFELEGIDPARSEDARATVRSLVASVQQDPAQQIIATQVAEEVAAGPRFQGLDERTTISRVTEALSRVGLAGFESRMVSQLSGGEMLRLVLADALARNPRYLVLDEVNTMLDSCLRPTLRKLLVQLAHEQGLGVVLISHDPADFACADTLVVLEAGRLFWQGNPAVCASDRARWSAIAGVSPRAEAWRARLCGKEAQHVVEALRLARVSGSAHDDLQPSSAQFTQLSADTAQALVSQPTCGQDAKVPPLLEVKNVSFTYPDASLQTLNNISLTLYPGEMCLLAGPSGAGKSSLAALAAGLLEPSEGSVELQGRPVHVGEVAYAMQRPENQLYRDTVEAELLVGPQNLGCSHEEQMRRMDVAAKAMGVHPDYYLRHPLQLSGGELRRVGIASVLSLGAPVCILDEPTAGLDAAGKADLIQALETLRATGVAILVLSHDLAEWLPYVSKICLLNAGSMSWQGTPSFLLQHDELWHQAGLLSPFAELCEPMCDPVHVEELERLTTRSHFKEKSSNPAQNLGLLSTKQNSSSNTAYANDTAACDSRVALILFLLATITCIIAPSISTLVLGALVLVVLWLRSRVRPFKELSRLAPVAWVMLLALIGSVLVLDGGAPISFGGLFGINPAAGLRSFMALLRIGLLALFALRIADTTTPTHVADACARLLHPLVHVGVPIQHLSLALGIALQYMPLMGTEYQRVALAARARGARLRDGRFLVRVRSALDIVAPVALAVLRRADYLGEALEARGYRPQTVIPYNAKPLSHREWLMLWCGISLCGIAVLLTVLLERPLV